MPIHTRSYYHFVEKDSGLVSPLWKVLHMLFFLGVVVSSLVTAFSFHDIFESFSHHCILYSKLILILEEYQPSQPVNASLPGNQTMGNEPGNQTMGNGLVVREGRYTVVVNDTHTAVVVVDYSRSSFSNVKYCDAVLFISLIGFVLGCFAAVIVLMCRRGGRAYKSDIFPRPWSYVYPLLALSISMLIASAVISNYIASGMENFCSNFNYFTGNESCTRQINQFTNNEGFGSKTFYDMYQICRYSSIIMTGMWVSQAVVLVMRVLFVADFQLRFVTISANRRRSLGYEQADMERAVLELQGLRQVRAVDGKDESSQEEENDNAAKVPESGIAGAKIPTTESIMSAAKVLGQIQKTYTMKKVKFTETDDKEDEEEKDIDENKKQGQDGAEEV